MVRVVGEGGGVGDGGGCTMHHFGHKTSTDRTYRFIMSRIQYRQHMQCITSRIQSIRIAHTTHTDRTRNASCRAYNASSRWGSPTFIR